MNTSGESLISSLLWSSTDLEIMRSLGGTNDTFIAAYPEANTMRVSDLLEAIRGKHGRRRKSRKGTPEQRCSRTGSSSPEPTTPPSGIQVDDADAS
jgi:hypothetical protein